MEYYDIRKDFAAYPNAWCFVLVGGRDIGKTYSTLKKYLEDDEKTVFVKRTNKDVELMCAGNSISKKNVEYDINFSPYKAINRDIGTNVKAFSIKPGIGAFYHATQEGSTAGSPISYIVSLHAVADVKGFDLSECVAIIFDEFIARLWERVDRKEGDQLMDLYETVSRDRFERTGQELKLILLANAVNVFNPVCETLELTDIIAEMDRVGPKTVYLEDRGILIRILPTPPEMLEKKKQRGIYKSMKGTAWGRMAFDNTFAYNDFTKIKKQALKNYKPVCSIAYKEKTWYLYINESKGYYLCGSRHNGTEFYNLNEETEQKRFYYDHVLDLANASIEGRMTFEKYGMYDLIMNYKKRFVL